MSEWDNKVVKNAVSPVTEQKICALKDEKEAAAAKYTNHIKDDGNKYISHHYICFGNFNISLD
jgi:hypothetical protein